MNKELWKKDDIIEGLNKKYGSENVCIVSTEGYDLTTNTYPIGEHNADRMRWAEDTVRQLYGTEISEIEENTHQFAYIKFACDKIGNIYGIVGAKSSFNKNWPSDVLFYDKAGEYKRGSRKKVTEYMNKNDLDWYKKEILIVKNKDKLDEKEARAHEKEIQEMFNLFN